MDNETRAELIRQLLDACDEGTYGAIRLAARTEVAALRTFLHESARQYRDAAADLKTVVDDVLPAAQRVRVAAGLPVPEAGDVADAWERTECELLTAFRDAYDEPLPTPLAEAVRRQLEAGVSRLEALRRLRERLPDAALSSPAPR